MGVKAITGYTVYCDGIEVDGKTCGASTGYQFSKTLVIEDAEAEGWLVRGRKAYCPECRPRYEKAIRRGKKPKVVEDCGPDLFSDLV